MNSVPKEALHELAPRGVLRAAINLGNPVLVRLNAESAKVSSMSVDLTRERAKRLGVPVKLVLFDTAGKAFGASKTG
jgi:polar amino acid transport system substrate-binding protein